MKTEAYRYDKVSSSLFTIGIVTIIGLSTPNLIKFIEANDVINWRLILAFDFVFILMLFYIILTKLIPAFKGKIALELNSVSIISYTKNVSIEWKNVKDIELMGLKTASLYITLKYDAGSTNHIRIPLGFTAGSASKIYDTALIYFHEANKNS